MAEETDNGKERGENTSKVRMTKKRKFVLQYMTSCNLQWGYEEGRGKKYFFSDGMAINAGIIERMIEAGLLAYTQGPLGVGQEIVRL